MPSSKKLIKIFFIADQVEVGDMEIEHCPAEKCGPMFLTSPNNLNISVFWEVNELTWLETMMMNRNRRGTILNCCQGTTLSTPYHYRNYLTIWWTWRIHLTIITRLFWTNQFSLTIHLRESDKRKTSENRRRLDQKEIQITQNEDARKRPEKYKERKWGHY